MYHGDVGIFTFREFLELVDRNSGGVEAKDQIS